MTMAKNDLEFYKQITKGFEHNHAFKYVSPEEQGRALKPCSILKSTAIEYSNSTTPTSPKGYIH